MTNTEIHLGDRRPPQLRRLRTAVPGPRSRELAARRAAALPAGLASASPAYAARGGGGVLVDVDGNSFIDFGSGIAVTSVGNAADRVTDRAAEQLRRFTHTCFLVNPYESYLEVAEALNRLTPGDHAKRTALFNTGAEAVENAVKYARAATGRPDVVVFDHAFHGRSLLAMTMTAKDTPYRAGFGPYAPGVHRTPFAYPFRWPSGAHNARAEAMAALTDLVDGRVGADRIAAVVVEPIQGEGGFVVPAPGFLPDLAQFCRDRGILLVADEVQTGIGRTGDWFACDHEGVVPDLVTTAKGLAGGLPLAAVTGRAEVMDAAPRGGIGGTYSGNPVACAAALGVLETVEQEDLLARARHIGDRLLARLTEAAADDPRIGEVRGRGAMIALEFVCGPGREPDPAALAATVARCHEQGLLVLTAGTFDNVLRLLPPLVMPADLLDEGITILTDALTTTRNRP